MVKCEICGEVFKAITYGHLKKHGTDLERYQEKYGDCKIQTNTGKTHFKRGHFPWNTGEKHSEKTRKKISESNKGQIAWNRGKKLSKEHKRKLSKAHKGKRISEETKEKISKTLKGIKLTEERKRKISKSLKGRKLSREWISKIKKNWFKKKHVPWNKGKEHLEETKKRISESVKGGKWVNDAYRNKMREITKRKWETEEFKKKFFEGMRKSTKISPNKLELEMIKIMKNNNLPFNFVGNGNFWIRGKETSYNPDFLHDDKNQRKIIEIFGDYWHNKEDHQKRDIKRIKTYKDKGFDVLVVWEKQIKNSEEEVIRRINNFLENGVQKQS